MTRMFWASHDKSDGLKLHLSFGGAHISVMMSVREAQSLAKEIHEAIDNMPRVASEADLGLVAA